METGTNNERTDENVHQKGALGLSVQVSSPSRPYPSRADKEEHVFVFMHFIVRQFMIRSTSNHYLLLRLLLLTRKLNEFSSAHEFGNPKQNFKHSSSECERKRHCTTTFVMAMLQRLLWPFSSLH